MTGCGKELAALRELVDGFERFHGGPEALREYLAACLDTTGYTAADLEASYPTRECALQIRAALAAAQALLAGEGVRGG